MKKSIVVLGMIAFFASCSSQKNTSITKEIDTKDVFEKAYYQTWVAGVQGGGSGLDLFISKSLLKSNEVALKVFFRGNEQVLEDSNNMYIARFKTTTNQLKDYEMNADIKKEYGNEYTVNKNQYKDLQDNEAILTVKRLDKEYIIRLKNIAKKETIPYPAIKK